LYSRVYKTIDKLQREGRPFPHTEHALYLIRGPHDYEIHTTANDSAIRHLADLLTGKPLLLLKAPGQSGAKSPEQQTTEPKAGLYLANLRPLLVLLNAFGCPEYLHTIAIEHYSPHFARAPWTALVAATDKPSWRLAHSAILAMGRQKPDYQIEKGSDGPMYKDWHPHAISTDQAKQIPFEWFMCFVRAVAQYEKGVDAGKLYITDGKVSQPTIPKYVPHLSRLLSNSVGAYADRPNEANADFIGRAGNCSGVGQSCRCIHTASSRRAQSRRKYHCSDSRHATAARQCCRPPITRTLLYDVSEHISSRCTGDRHWSPSIVRTC
jgi:hypothetical protein